MVAWQPHRTPGAEAFLGGAAGLGCRRSRGSLPARADGTCQGKFCCCSRACGSGKGGACPAEQLRPQRSPQMRRPGCLGRTRRAPLGGRGQRRQSEVGHPPALGHQSAAFWWVGLRPQVADSSWSWARGGGGTRGAHLGVGITQEDVWKGEWREARTEPQLPKGCRPPRARGGRAGLGGGLPGSRGGAARGFPGHPGAGAHCRASAPCACLEAVTLPALRREPRSAGI